MKAAVPATLKCERYRVLEVLGQGGEGVVVVANDRIFGRDVVLKWRHDAASARRPSREEAHLIGIHHPGIVRVEDIFAEPSLGATVLVERRLVGRDWRHFIRETPDRDEIASLGYELLDALLFLHASGVRHGDLKPANILVTLSRGSRRPVLIDFGMASPVDDPELPGGTPLYLAPEIASGGTPSAAMDFWALGVVLEQTARGSETPRRHGDRRSPSIGDALDTLIEDLTHEDPRSRMEAVRRRARVRRSSAAVLPDRLPFVGRRDAVETIERAILDQWSGRGDVGVIRVGGDCASGRRRVLEEVWLDLRRRDIAALHLDARLPPAAWLEYAAVESGVPLSRVRHEDSDREPPKPGEVVARLMRFAEKRPLAIVLTPEAVESSDARAFLAAFDVAARAALRSGTGSSLPVVISCAETPAASTIVTLGPLDVVDVKELIASTFHLGNDDQTVARRAAVLLHRLSTGRPARLDALLRRGVEEGSIGFLEGSFHCEEAPLTARADLLAAVTDVSMLLGEDATALVSALAANGNALDRSALLETLGWDERRLSVALAETIDAGCVRRAARDDHPFILARTAVTEDVRTGPIWQASRGSHDDNRIEGLRSLVRRLSPWLRSADPGALRFHLDRAMAGATAFDEIADAVLLVARSFFAEGRHDEGRARLDPLLALGAGHPARVESEPLVAARLARSEGRAAALAFLVGRIASVAAERRTSDVAGIDTHLGRLNAEAAYYALLVGDVAAATEHARAAIVSPIIDVKARACTFLAAALTRAGRSDDAELAFTEASRLWAELGDERRVAATSANFAMLDLQAGRTSRAIVKLRSAISSLEVVGDTDQLAGALTNLGVVLQRRNENVASAAAHARSHWLYSIAGESVAAAAALASRGIARREAGQLASALLDLEAAHRAHAPAEIDRVDTLIRVNLARTLWLTVRRRPARSLLGSTIRRARRRVADRERCVLYATAAWLRAIDGRDRASRRWQERARRCGAGSDRETSMDLETAERLCGGATEHDGPSIVIDRLIGANAPRPPTLSTIAAALRAPRVEIRWLGCCSAILARACEGRWPAAARHLERMLSMQRLGEQDMTGAERRVLRTGVVTPVYDRLVAELRALVGPHRDSGDDGVFGKLAARIASTNDDAAVLEYVLDAALEATPAVRAAVIVPAEGGDYRVIASRERSHGTMTSHAVEFSRLVIREVFATGAPLLVADAGNDDRLGFAPSVQRLGLRSILCIPLKRRGVDFGALYADSPLAENAFDETHRRRLESLGAFVAACMGRDDKKGRRAPGSRLAKELDTRELELATRTRELDQSRARQGAGLIVGSSEPVRRVNEMIRKVGPTEISVLITGETGTGKELAAEAIHAASLRRAAPFIAVNCAALPRHLAESEFFGHERGAFTGAVKAEPGLFRMADGGTLFLDEIGELESALQAKLLRALESKKVRPVGGRKERSVDVRVIAATNRSLKKSKEFRQDLYFRFAGVELEMPPLRERAGDLPLLIRHFLEGSNAKDREFEPAALAAMNDYEWPGNVRELKNVIDRLTLVVRGRPILLTDLPVEISSFKGQKPSTLAEAELRAIRQALRFAGGEKKEAARLLGISRSALYDKLSRVGPELAEP